MKLTILAAQTLVIQVPSVSLPTYHPAFWFGLYVLLAYIAVGLTMRISDARRGRRGVLLQVFAPDPTFFCFAPVFFPMLLTMLVGKVGLTLCRIPYRILVGRWN